MIFPKWHPGLEFLYDPGKKKNTLFDFHLTFYQQSTLFTFLNLKNGCSSLFFFPQEVSCVDCLFYEKWAKVISLPGWKVLLGSPFPVVSGSECCEAEPSLPRENTLTPSHTQDFCVTEKYWIMEFGWLFLISVETLFSLIHLIWLILKHNELIRLCYLKFLQNHRVHNWTKTTFSSGE